MSASGFLSGARNVHQLVQIVVELPMIFDRHSKRTIVSTKFNKEIEKSWKKFPFRWYLLMAQLLVLHVYSVVHLIQLAREFQRNESFKSLEEILVYIMACGMTGQSLLTWMTYHKDPCTHAYLDTELPKAAGAKYLGFPTRKRLPDIKEAAGYGMFLGIQILPLISTIMVFLRPYQPVRSLLALLEIPEPTLQILSCILTAIIGTNGGLMCGSILLNMVLGTFLFICIAKRNLEANGNFKKCYRLHNELSILIKLGSQKYSRLVPGMTLAGILFCVFANTGIVKLRNRVELVFLIFCFAVTIIFTIFILLLSEYASQPNVLTQELLAKWRGVKLGQAAKKELKSMQVLSINLGPFFPIDKMTGMNILDSIMDYTMTAVTMSNV